MEVVIPIKNANQNLGIVGEITARFYDQSSLNSFDRFYNSLIRVLAKKERKWLRYYKLGKLKKVDKIKNIVCYNGLEAVMKRLASINTYTCNLNYCALGTGTPVTVSVNDTKLNTEAYRNATASGTGADNICYVTAYYTETECNGTYYEFGNFADGTGAADSGQIWSHITCNWVKDAVTVLVVDCKYTITNV